MKNHLMNFKIQVRKICNYSLLLGFAFLIPNHPIWSEANFSKEELSLNGFRNPSIGLEYRKNQYSIHGGYYVTNFEEGVTTRFYKVGGSYWFFPKDFSLDQSGNPSAFYIGASYGSGINLDYKGKDTFMMETGYKWFIWKGLNFRIGLIGLFANEESAKLNPTPSISYSLFF